jgi:hypothetical protein
MDSYKVESPEDELNDNDILEVAYENAFLLFSETKTFTDIALTPYMSESYMPFDPYELMDDETFQTTKLSILDWFGDIEEYEKCSFIRDYSYDSYVTLMTPYDTSSKS